MTSAIAFRRPGVVDKGAPLKLPRSVKALGFVSLLTDASSEMIYPLLPAFLTAGSRQTSPETLAAGERAPSRASSAS